MIPAEIIPEAEPDVSVPEAAPDASVSAEEARIIEAYARREASAKRYSWFEPGHVFMIQDLERRLLLALKRRGVTSLSSKQILEIGCGNGHWLREFIKWGAAPENIAGVDLLPERIALARKLSPPGISLAHGNAAHLKFPSASFDIVFQTTVFTSILDHGLKREIANEMMRVLKPDGLAFWYDFRVNNPRNPDVRGIGKSEIEKLFSGWRVSLETITLAPPLARALAPYSWLGSHLLSKIPWACSHYLGTIQKLR